ncbi:MAG: hypothetical protein JXB85_03540 [Anaerolineales bacterium]|nr:hypothetical protein [Anaerolineales bacterium]
MQPTAVDQIVFTTALRSSYGASCARLLIDSLRSFGGEIGRAPFWVFAAGSWSEAAVLAGEGVRVFPLEIPDPIENYIFSEKVVACARAEEMAAGQIRSLIWIDPNCLVVNPPVLYALGEKYDAALRPVHIRNVGLPAGGPLDAYWKGIYAALGVDDVAMTVRTFVDGQTLRAYFNSHAFAINPDLGLLQHWSELFAALVLDRDYQQAACQDQRHQVFLFQALLSGLLATALDPERMRNLPPTYNYPYNLQGAVRSEARARALNDLVSFSYEERSLNPDEITDIEVQQPLRTWLMKRVGQAS